MIAIVAMHIRGKFATSCIRGLRRLHPRLSWVSQSKFIIRTGILREYSADSFKGLGFVLQEIKKFRQCGETTGILFIFPFLQYIQV